MWNVNPKFKRGRGDDSPEGTLPESIFNCGTVFGLITTSVWIDLLSTVRLRGDAFSSHPRVPEDYETAVIRLIYQASENSAYLFVGRFLLDVSDSLCASW